MEIMRTLAAWSEEHFANMGYSPIDVVNEFARELQKEVDLTHEGRATDRLRLAFEDDSEIVFPMVYWEATTRNILAVEEIKGISLAHVSNGELSKSERKRVVANGARAVLRQCLELGFFHADPHPGNLFALPGGRIAFIDCGMTGQLDTRASQQLADLISAVVNGDVDRVITVAGALADVDPIKLENRLAAGPVAPGTARVVNEKLMQVERALLEPKGQRGRPFIRHLLVAPQPSYRSAYLPRIWDDIDRKDFAAVPAHEAEIAAAFNRAADILQEANALLDSGR